MAKPNAKTNAVAPITSTDSLPNIDTLLADAPVLETLVQQAADKQAADKLAQQTADDAARLKLAQQELVDAIKSLSVDKNVVLANVIRTYSVYGNGLEPVSMPSKLAGSTEGKVLTWVMENPDKLIALNKAVTTDNAAKTSDQIIAKVVSVIKAHITVKPYAACF